jgi:hypothetical protein
VVSGSKFNWLIDWLVVNINFYSYIVVCNIELTSMYNNSECELKVMLKWQAMYLLDGCKYLLTGSAYISPVDSICNHQIKNWCRQIVKYNNAYNSPVNSICNHQIKNWCQHIVKYNKAYTLPVNSICNHKIKDWW